MAGNIFTPQQLSTAAWYADTSITIVRSEPPGMHFDNHVPTPSHARCTKCDTRVMLPKSVDKIVALICPQCGGPLDA